MRTKLYPEKLPELWPRLKARLVILFNYYIYLTFNIIFNIINHFRGIIHKSSLSEGWSMIFPGADRSVALRTQRFLYEKYKQRPVQVQTYFTLK